MTSHRWNASAATCIAAIAFAGSSFAAQHDEGAADVGKAPPPAMAAGESIVVTATVEAVDEAKRKITFKKPDGDRIVVTAGPEVQNFDQIDVGDELVVEYTEAVAAAIDPAGGAPAASARRTVETAPPGAKPEMKAREVVELRAKIVAVDSVAREVKIETPAGDQQTFRVGKEVERFAELRPGEDVVIRFTDAIAIKIREP